MSALLVVTPTLGDQMLYLEGLVSAIRRDVEGALHVLACPSGRVEQLRTHFPGVVVTSDHGREGGMYGAINAGTAAGGGNWEWFTYINDDDVLLEGFPQMAREHMGKGRPRSIGYGRTAYLDEGGSIIAEMPIERNPRNLRSLMRQMIAPMIQQGTLIGRPVIEELSGFDATYRHVADQDFFARAVCANVEFCYYDLMVGGYRLRKGQLASDRKGVTSECVMVRNRVFRERPRPVQDAFQRLRFRVSNWRVYVQRLRKSGWCRSARLIDKAQ